MHLDNKRLPKSLDSRLTEVMKDESSSCGFFKKRKYSVELVVTFGD